MQKKSTHPALYLYFASHNPNPAAAALLVGLTQYFSFYNETRPHQSLSYQTPGKVHRSAQGGGALIVDKYGSAETAVLKEPA